MKQSVAHHSQVACLAFLQATFSRGIELPCRAKVENQGISILWDLSVSLLCCMQIWLAAVSIPPGSLWVLPLCTDDRNSRSEARLPLVRHRDVDCRVLRLRLRRPVRLQSYLVRPFYLTALAPNKLQLHLCTIRMEADEDLNASR